MNPSVSHRCVVGLVIFLLFAAFHLNAEVGVTLRTGDMFDLRLGGIPQEYAAEFAFQYTIGQDGTINVPLIGEIKAVGLTPSQLERAIQAKLVTDKVFSHPAVLINVAQAARFVSISGGVLAPQRLSWSPDLTLSSGIGNCGGLGVFSNGKGIRIVRDGKVAGSYSLKELSKDPSKDPKLFPGDQVIVPE
jgi:polysaccharide biosynthesis/export protein